MKKTKLRALIDDKTGLWKIVAKHYGKRQWEQFSKFWYTDSDTCERVMENIVNLYANEFVRG